MSVIGIGTDIIDSNRIAEMTPAMRDKLAKRVLTPVELQTYASKKDSSEFLAKRWAAKEAAAKALGTGIAAGVSFQHFEITNLPSGAPQLSLTGEALDKAHSLGANTWHISLADDQHLATAFVILSAS